MDTPSNQKYPTKEVIGTFLYTLLLASIVAMIYVLHKDSNILFGVSGVPNFEMFLPLVVCLTLLAPFLVVATVYKNFSSIAKTFLVLLAILMFVLIVAYMPSSNEVGESFGIVGFAFIIFVMLQTLVGGALFLVSVGFGLFLKRFYEVQAKTVRRTLFIFPYFITLAILSNILFIARTAENVTCEDMVYEKQSACYFAFAKKTGDLDSCMKVTINNNSLYQDSSTMKWGGATAHCIESAVSRMEEMNILTPTNCETLLSEDAKSVCYNRVAVKIQEPLLCEKVKDTYEKNVHILMPAMKFFDDNPKLDRASCYLNIKSGKLE